jgi:hypothetical protein
MPQGCGGRSVIGDLATEVELHISLFQICFIDNSVQKHQLARIGAGKAARPGMSAWTSVLKTFGALAALVWRISSARVSTQKSLAPLQAFAVYRARRFCPGPS